MYPKISELDDSLILQQFEDGVNNVYLATIKGQMVVYKHIQEISKANKSLAKKILKTIDQPIKDYFHRYLVNTTYKRKNSKDNGEREEMILSKWRQCQIPSSQILERHEDAIIYSYIDSENYKQLLSSNTKKTDEVESLISLIGNIRDVAKKENNKLLLHPDMRLKNFLYDFDTSTAVAIDPGIIIDDQMSFDDLDATINLVFAYDFFNIESSHKINYLEKFAESLSNNERKEAASHIKHMSPAAKLYFTSKHKLHNLLSNKKSDNICNLYSKNNSRIIADIMNS